MKVVKQIAGFLFLPLALGPLVLSLVFLIQQQNVRMHMKEALKEEELMILTLSSEEVIWHKKGKEIVVKGHLFDVHSFTPLGNDLFEIKGLFDHKEQALYAKLNSQMETKRQTSSVLSCFQKWFSMLYTDSMQHGLSLFALATLRPSFLVSHALNYPDTYLAIIVPPPRYS